MELDETIQTQKQQWWFRFALLETQVKLLQERVTAMEQEKCPDCGYAPGERGEKSLEHKSINKSILDGVPVDDKAFPLKRHLPQGGSSSSSLRDDTLHIVGACPHCGNPIYGPQYAKGADDELKVRRTCDCWRKQGMVSNVMEHQGK